MGLSKKEIEERAQEWRREKAAVYKQYVRTSAVGLEVGLSVVVGIVLGYFADRYFNIEPWGIVAGFFVGAMAATKRLIVFSKQYLRENREEEKKAVKNYDDLPN